MVKKVIVLVIIFLFCTLLGDANSDIIQNRFIFTGENDSWSAVYVHNTMGWFTQSTYGLGFRSKGNDYLTVTYKKDLSNLADVKQFKLSYQLDSSSGYDSMDGPPGTKNFTFQGASGSLIRQDAVYTVTVNLDGSMQTIELKNNQLYQIAAVFLDRPIGFVMH